MRETSTAFILIPMLVTVSVLTPIFIHTQYWMLIPVGASVVVGVIAFLLYRLTHKNEQHE